MSRTRSGAYKRYGGQILREIMVRIAIDPFVNDRAMTELLQKTLPDRNNVDMYMLNNVRIRERRKKLALDSVNIQFDPKHFDRTFIDSYIDTAENYTQGK